MTIKETILLQFVLPLSMNAMLNPKTTGIVVGSLGMYAMGWDHVIGTYLINRPKIFAIGSTASDVVAASAMYLTFFKRNGASEEDRAARTERDLSFLKLQVKSSAISLAWYYSVARAFQMMDVGEGRLTRLFVQNTVLVLPAVASELRSDMETQIAIENYEKRNGEDRLTLKMLNL